MTTSTIRNSIKNIWIYTGFSVVILLFFNFYIYKDNQNDFLSIQKNIANATIKALEAQIELPLVTAHNEDVTARLEEIELEPNTLSVEIFDNKNSLVASRVNKISELNNYSTFEQDIFNKQNNYIQDIFSEGDEPIEPQLIGSIIIKMENYDALQEYINNPLVYLYNLLLFSFLALFGVWLYIRLGITSRNISLISKFLDEPNRKNHQLSNLKELKKLYRSASQAVDKLSKQDIQLSTLQQEIQYAREDSNLELNRFLEFLIASEHINFNDNLRVFVDAVLSNKSEQKSMVNIPREISQNIARHSDLLTEHNVTIINNILGHLDEYSVFIDKPLFSRFLNLFIEQVIILCKHSEIKINADINSLYGNSHMLRLSFESKSKAFHNAFEHQTLFDFHATPEVSIETNNASFIACKHLVQKAGGDYIYLKDEIRFEFPVLIEKNMVAPNSLSLIHPLEIQRSLLVFDSDPTDRIVLMGYLEKFGQVADKATTKQVALQKIRQNHYDIICVNSDFFNSPDPYFLTNFKSEYLALSRKPLILVISSKEEVVESEYFQSFEVRFLKKPIDLQSLKNILINLS